MWLLLFKRREPTGNKLRKITSDGTTTDYAGGIEYKNNALESVHHSEGRVTPSIENPGQMMFKYSIKDHPSIRRDRSGQQSNHVFRFKRRWDTDNWWGRLGDIAGSGPPASRFLHFNAHWTLPLRDHPINIFKISCAAFEITVPGPKTPTTPLS